MFFELLGLSNSSVAVGDKRPRLDWLRASKRALKPSATIDRSKLQWHLGRISANPRPKRRVLSSLGKTRILIVDTAGNCLILRLSVWALDAKVLSLKAGEYHGGTRCRRVYGPVIGRMLLGVDDVGARQAFAEITVDPKTVQKPASLVTKQ